MGLGDFIFLVDKLGVFGLALTALFVFVMFAGSVVDIMQFWWRVKRFRHRRRRSEYNRIKAEVLMEQHEARRRDAST